MRKSILWLIALALAIACVLETGRAIPAFARKYNMSCTTCHSPFPRMKPFGADFAGNGFQLEGQEPSRYFVDTGDDLLNLLRDFPVAVRLEGYMRYNYKSEGKTDFQTPYVVKLLSGGNVTKDISYYFYFFFGERGEVAGLEDAFLYFNNLFGSELDIQFGQFQVSDPLFKRELRLTFEDYQIYGATPGLSSASLTYDRGIIFSHGLFAGNGIVLEVLNGNGIGPADANRAFDNDANKNFMGRISQEIGSAFRLGAFGYYGKEEQSGFRNFTRMIGPDLSVSYDQFEVNAQAAWRYDDNPFFVSTTGRRETRGGFGEIIVTPEGDKSRVYGVLLYNIVRSDVSSLDYQSVSGHIGYLLRRNVRLTAEYSYNIDLEAHGITAGFVMAF